MVSGQDTKVETGKTWLFCLMTFIYENMLGEHSWGTGCIPKHGGWRRTTIPIFDINLKNSALTDFLKTIKNLF